MKESYIHQYGVALEKTDWEARGKNGTIVSTRKDGVTVSQHYKAAVLDGQVTYTFPHSNLLAKTEEYKNGKLLLSRTHFTSGIPKWEEKFEADDVSIITIWYEDGSPQSIEKYTGNYLNSGKYFTFSNDLESSVVSGKGTRIKRDPYGGIISEDEINGGQLTLRTTFHQNGDPKSISIATFVNGIAEGTRKTFWIGGLPNTVEEWRNGQQDGITTIFQNGEKRAEVTYIAGVKNGVERRFNDQQVLAEEINWREDKKHGPSKSYFENNTSTTWFHNGRVVTKHKFDEFAR